MARIDMNNFSKIEKERNTIHDRVPATYTVFEHDGKKYFQIDTYGKADRKYTEKISQSFQLDRESAEKVINLLLREFSVTIEK